ncbi:MAG TPA: hypothetical protein DCY94_00090 [Firmicutes bacterium]|nr:hypothetical protein [Bacillota bacterium]
MKDNKRKVILFIALVLVAIVIVVLAIVFSKKETKYEHSASKNVVASLNANSQAEVDKLIREDLEENKHTLENAKIYIDPYGNSPLSALIAFKTDSKTSVKVTVKGRHGDDITSEHKEAEYHYIPVYGLYQDYENKVEITTGTGEKTTLRISIDKIEGLPSMKVNARTEEAYKDGIYLISSPISMSSFGIDSYGEIRWLPSERYYHDIEVLNNGHILIGGNEIADNSLASKIYEMDLLGRIYNEYEIAEGYLGDFYVKSNGNILVASKKENRATYSDYILEIDHDTGKIVKYWDIIEALRTIDPTYGNDLPEGYFYNAGIEYEESSDTLLLTYWGGEFILNLGYSDNAVRWIFSDPKNFNTSFESVLLKGSEGFVYPKSMHSATLTNDTLRVFDNGYSTNIGEATISNLAGSHSSANTYKITGNTITLTTAIDEDKSLFSYALADYRIDGNRETILFGRELKNVDYSKNVNINEWSPLTTRLIENVSGKKVLDIEIDQATQFVEAIDLTKNVNFDFETAGAFTTLKPSLKEDLTVELKNQIKSATEKVDYNFGYSKNYIEHDIAFMYSDEAKLILINDKEEGTVYTLKVKDEKQSKKIVTDLSSGSYYVYILENGKMFKTDSKIEIK